MIRSLIASGLMHLSIVALLIVLSLIEPPVREHFMKLPSISAKMLPPPGPKQQGKFSPLKPGEVVEAPKLVATPAPKKPTVKKVAAAGAESVKKKIAKEYTVLEKATPTPEPTPETKDEGKDKAKNEGKDKEDKEGDKPKATGSPAPAATPAPAVELEGLPTGEGKKVERGSLSWGTMPDGPAGGGGGAFSELGQNYAYIALWHIQQNFHPPYEMPGVTCTIQFKVMKDGTIADPKITTSSGRSDLDQSALRALMQTENLQPLYDDYSKPYTLAEVTFEFEKKPE